MKKINTISFDEKIETFLTMTPVTLDEFLPSSKFAEKDDLEIESFGFDADGNLGNGFHGFR